MLKITVYLQPDGETLGIKEAICNALEPLGNIQRVEVSGEASPVQLRIGK